MTLLRVCILLATTTFLHAELTDEQKRVPLEVDAPDASVSKIVLLAGSVSNKPGQHEYFAGCALLMKCLKQTPGVWPVMAAEGWPKNEAIFKNAKAVVMYMDGGAKCALLQPSRWELLRGLMKQGVGFTVLHQSVDIPEDHAEDFKTWAGAVWQKDIGSRGHWDMTFEPKGGHDILRGVGTLAAPKDGWLYNLHFADKNVTPLLTGEVPDKSRSTADAKSHAGRAEVIAWAHERADGGRAFGFTGCDLHKNWGVEAQRRLVVNGILWSAKLPVPTEGAPVKCEDTDLTANFDLKPGKLPTSAGN
jgi:hypothetical protein